MSQTKYRCSLEVKISGPSQNFKLATPLNQCHSIDSFLTFFFQVLFPPHQQPIVAVAPETGIAPGPAAAHGPRFARPNQVCQGRRRRRVLAKRRPAKEPDFVALLETRGARLVVALDVVVVHRGVKFGSRTTCRHGNRRVWRAVATIRKKSRVPQSGVMAKNPKRTSTLCFGVGC